MSGSGSVTLENAHINGVDPNIFQVVADAGDTDGQLSEPRRLKVIRRSVTDRRYVGCGVRGASDHDEGRPVADRSHTAERQRGAARRVRRIRSHGGSDRPPRRSVAVVVGDEYRRRASGDPGAGRRHARRIVADVGLECAVVVADLACGRSRDQAARGDRAQHAGQPRAGCAGTVAGTACASTDGPAPTAPGTTPIQETAAPQALSTPTQPGSVVPPLPPPVEIKPAPAPQARPQQPKARPPLALTPGTNSCRNDGRRPRKRDSARR